jgi:mannose-6-phosphate isomerase-like protein (cupin superfamily)
VTFEMAEVAADDPRWTRTDGIFVPRTGGITKWVGGDTTTVKISREQTDGALGVIEIAVHPGGGAAAHSHGREAEAFYVLSGDFEMINGNKVIHAGPGDFFYVPQGNRHGFTNIGKLTGLLLTFMIPGGHEEFWLETGQDPVPGEYPPAWGPEKMAEVMPLIAEHEVTMMPQLPDGVPGDR